MPEIDPDLDPIIVTDGDARSSYKAEPQPPRYTICRGGKRGAFGVSVHVAASFDRLFAGTGRGLLIAQAAQRRDPDVETARIWRMSLQIFWH